MQRGFEHGLSLAQLTVLLPVVVLLPGASGHQWRPRAGQYHRTTSPPGPAITLLGRRPVAEILQAETS